MADRATQEVKAGRARRRGLLNVREVAGLCVASIVGGLVGAEIGTCTYTPGEDRKSTVGHTAPADEHGGLIVEVRIVRGMVSVVARQEDFRLERLLGPQAGLAGPSGFQSAVSEFMSQIVGSGRASGGVTIQVEKLNRLLYVVADLQTELVKHGLKGAGVELLEGGNG